VFPLVAMALLAAACSSPSTHPTVPGGQGKFWPLGAVSEVPPPGQCVSGFQCRGVSVSCPGVESDTDATLDIGKPSGRARGMAVLLSGGGGRQLWQYEAQNDINMQNKAGGGGAHGQVDQQAAAMASQTLQGLRDHGIEVVQVSWHQAWIDAPEGQEVGPARLACRPATLLQWIHDTLYTPLDVRENGLGCGFCAVGNSGGGAAIAYALAFYGLGKVLRGALISGGPPYTGLDRSCTDQAPYAFKRGIATVFDASYGFFHRDGPCYRSDASFRQQWVRDSVDTGGFVYRYPHTRLLLLLGSDDNPAIAAHQQLYQRKLQQAGSPHLDQNTVAGMTHAITASSQGLSLISGFLLTL
jgi:hypothetical protein